MNPLSPTRACINALTRRKGTHQRRYRGMRVSDSRTRGSLSRSRVAVAPRRCGSTVYTGLWHYIPLRTLHGSLMVTPNAGARGGAETELANEVGGSA